MDANGDNPPTLFITSFKDCRLLLNYQMGLQNENVGIITRKCSQILKYLYMQNLKWKNWAMRKDGIKSQTSFK